MHSSSPFYKTPSKVPHTMAADDMSTTPVRPLFYTSYGGHGAWVMLHASWPDMRGGVRGGGERG
ncbi:hypothetical protein F383_33232 [Gossypium arboreum]|uniref:Uncharacterized protein n=1 Tax=Gossypium arboreum TaxID=29729 RepID=A0A0B0N528_GOSAR|nr:hypothetical protein F383_33232 [Gossypium arboreum]